MIVFCDEVGMASIFGPLGVAAVAFEDNHPQIKGVKDSKQLSKQKREELYPIIQKEAQCATAFASINRIESMNVFYARFYAMKVAVEKLVKQGVKIDKIIVDGKFIIPNLDYPQEAVIKADAKFWQCGAASIIAKVKRDNMIAELGKLEKYSYYGLESNAGYYTPEHRAGVILHGPTDLHRTTFDFFKYCLFCHEKYKELGNTYEEYLEYEKQEEKKNGSSFYKLWKNSSKNIWKEIKYGKVL